jgi:hypothetical protein
MEEKYVIVKAFMEGSMIGLVCEHVGYEHVGTNDLRVCLGEFRPITGPLDTGDAELLSQVMGQITAFVTDRSTPPAASRGAESSRSGPME